MFAPAIGPRDIALKFLESLGQEGDYIVCASEIIAKRQAIPFQSNDRGEYSADKAGPCPTLDALIQALVQQGVPSLKRRVKMAREKVEECKLFNPTMNREKAEAFLKDPQNQRSLILRKCSQGEKYFVATMKYFDGGVSRFFNYRYEFVEDQFKTDGGRLVPSIAELIRDRMSKDGLWLLPRDLELLTDEEKAQLKRLAPIEKKYEKVVNCSLFDPNIVTSEQAHHFVTHPGFRRKVVLWVEPLIHSLTVSYGIDLKTSKSTKFFVMENCFQLQASDKVFYSIAEILDYLGS